MNEVVDDGLSWRGLLSGLPESRGNAHREVPASHPIIAKLRIAAPSLLRDRRGWSSALLRAPLCSTTGSDCSCGHMWLYFRHGRRHPRAQEQPEPVHPPDRGGRAHFHHRPRTRGRRARSAGVGDLVQGGTPKSIRGAGRGRRDSSSNRRGRPHRGLAGYPSSGRDRCGAHRQRPWRSVAAGLTVRAVLSGVSPRPREFDTSSPAHSYRRSSNGILRCARPCERRDGA